jgi:hypothetical protein
MCAIAVFEAFLVSEASEILPSLCPYLRRPRYFLARERDAGVQFECEPIYFEVVLTNELVDPSLADVAIRSDEVADNRELRGHEDLLGPAIRRLGGTTPK